MLFGFHCILYSYKYSKNDRKHHNSGGRVTRGAPLIRGASISFFDPAFTITFLSSSTRCTSHHPHPSHEHAHDGADHLNLFPVPPALARLVGQRMRDQGQPV